MCWQVHLQDKSDFFNSLRTVRQNPGYRENTGNRAVIARSPFDFATATLTCACGTGAGRTGFSDEAISGFGQGLLRCARNDTWTFGHTVEVLSHSPYRLGMSLFLPQDSNCRGNVTAELRHGAAQPGCQRLVIWRFERFTKARFLSY